jgi:hypothetical protein
MRIQSILFFASLFLVSCVSSNSDQNSQDPLWELEKKIVEEGENIEVEEINKAIEQATTMRLSWAYSPVTIAIRVAGQQMISPEIKIIAKSKSGNELVTHAVVMVEKKNLQDDSIKNQYYRIELKLGGSIWQVVDIKKAWNCRANRGHTEVSGELCN